MNAVYLKDLAERVLATFSVAFVGAWLPSVLDAGGDWQAVINLSTAQKALLAGGAAVLTLAKGVIAKLIGDSDSASLVPTLIVGEADSGPRPVAG